MNLKQLAHRVSPESPTLHIIFYKNLKTKCTITLTTMTVLPCFRPTLTAAAVQRQKFNRETNQQKQ